MNILDILYAVDGISSVGVCEFNTLKHYMNESAIAKAYNYCENAHSVYVALFPYFNKPQNGNLSIYARGKDYHSVICDILTPISDQIERKTNAKSVVLVDNSPLNEVQAARLSGVGKIGENGLIFDKIYGSFVFIGTILTSIPFKQMPAILSDNTHIIPPDKDSKIIDCLHCGLCRKHCLGHAIGENGKINCENCLSELTQTKKDLTDEQENLLLKHNLIWGCDTCQLVCPQNKNVPFTKNKSFTENLINSLSLEDIENLTRKQFNEKYKDRAFTWRGTKPLIRNLTLKG